MVAPVSATLDRVQPLTLECPTLSSKGDSVQGTIELDPLLSEVGLTGRRLLRVGVFTIEVPERLLCPFKQCLHAIRGPTHNDSRGMKVLAEVQN